MSKNSKFTTLDFFIIFALLVAAAISEVIDTSHQAYALTQTNSGFTANNNVIGANVSANIYCANNNIGSNISTSPDCSLSHK
jgi:hypothetical protein